MSDLPKSFTLVRKEAQAEAKAELSYGQALWYAWGRLDSGQYVGEAFRTLDAFKFAESVKAATLKFELEETTHLESIQGAWGRYVEDES